MIFKIFPSTLIFLLLFSLFPVLSYSQGDLMVMPKRLVFDGTQRAQEIHLINTGRDSSTYAISFVQYKMTKAGSFEEVIEPEAEQRFASEFLRYYPRIVTLPPNEAQTLRVQVTRTNNLTEGEYRSHLYFRAIEKRGELENLQENSGDNLSIKIKTVFGISIPVIIRNGDDSTYIEFSDLILNQDKEVPELTMVLNRKGNMSVYGNLLITYISPEGRATEISMIKGIAVYTPNKQRIFTMTLNKTEDIDFNKGKIKILYKNESGRVYGETTVNLN
jgi:hypothetical protein